MPEMQLRVVRQGLLIRPVGGGEPKLISFDEPSPTVMADGIGGICRRGWQYAVVGGTTLMPPDLVPRESDEVDFAAELAALRAHEASVD